MGVDETKNIYAQLRGNNCLYILFISFSHAGERDFALLRVSFCWIVSMVLNLFLFFMTSEAGLW